LLTGLEVEQPTIDSTISPWSPASPPHLGLKGFPLRLRGFSRSEAHTGRRDALAVRAGLRALAGGEHRAERLVEYLRASSSPKLRQGGYSRSLLEPCRRSE
jgi:hypothetical protein